MRSASRFRGYLGIGNRMSQGCGCVIGILTDANFRRWEERRMHSGPGVNELGGKGESTSASSEEMLDRERGLPAVGRNGGGKKGD